CEKKSLMFREQLLFLAIPFDKQLVAFVRDGSCLPGCQFVRADVVSKPLCIGLSQSRVFVVAMRLAGDELPIAVALQPGVGDVITRFQVLAEDRLGLVSVVTQDGSVIDNPALGVLDLDGSRISGRQRRDVGDQFWFVENASFLVGEDAVVGEVLFPRRLFAWNDGCVT